LGVPRDADKKVIKSAYRKLALEFHPDKIKVFENLIISCLCLSPITCFRGERKKGRKLK